MHPIHTNFSGSMTSDIRLMGLSTVIFKAYDVFGQLEYEP